MQGGGGADEIRTYERNFVAKSICSTAKGLAKREGEAKVGGGSEKPKYFLVFRSPCTTFAAARRK